MFIEHPHLDSIDSTLKERTISTRVKSVFVMHATPIPGAETKTVPILLLHGAKFSASTWDQTGTIAALCEAGFHVYVSVLLSLSLWVDGYVAGGEGLFNFLTSSC